MGVISILTAKVKQGKAIAEGYTRVALNIRTTIMVYREEEYCKKCPLAHNEGRYTGQCNKKEGGCGCGISAKTSQSMFNCPKGFWGSDWFKPLVFKEFLENQK